MEEFNTTQLQKKKKCSKKIVFYISSQYEAKSTKEPTIFNPKIKVNGHHASCKGTKKNFNIVIQQISSQGKKKVLLKFTKKINMILSTSSIISILKQNQLIKMGRRQNLKSKFKSL